MRSEQIFGVALLAIGLFLLYFGFQATETVGKQIHESVTGQFTETTTWYLIFGTLSALGGIGLLTSPAFTTTD